MCGCGVRVCLCVWVGVCGVRKSSDTRLRITAGRAHSRKKPRTHPFSQSARPTKTTSHGKTNYSPYFECMCESAESFLACTCKCGVCECECECVVVCTMPREVWWLFKIKSDGDDVENLQPSAPLTKSTRTKKTGAVPNNFWCFRYSMSVKNI